MAYKGRLVIAAKFYLLLLKSQISTLTNPSEKSHRTRSRLIRVDFIGIFGNLVTTFPLESTERRAKALSSHWPKMSLGGDCWPMRAQTAGVTKREGRKEGDSDANR